MLANLSHRGVARPRRLLQAKLLARHLLDVAPQPDVGLPVENMVFMVAAFCGFFLPEREQDVPGCQDGDKPFVQTFQDSAHFFINSSTLFKSGA